MRERVRELVDGARAAIEAHRHRIDDLNVYPVPDGDTGTNLTLTVRAISEALAGDGPDDRAGLAKEVSRAALMGARGNSGVILSQIVRGATDSLAETDDLARAFRSASDAAYRAVKKPVEGTMLTAIRALADAAERGLTLPEIVAAGDETVAQTREMLPVLREAGVVDAGAAGLVEIVRGIAAVVSGEPLPEAPEQVEDALGLEAIHQELSRFRYCTVFVVEGDDLDLPALESELEQIGDSLLVVGDRSALKVHVHTDDPGRALSLGVARGAIGGVEIANMHEQTLEREDRLLHAVPIDRPTSAVVAVAAGDGNRALFESGGALVVDGGETMNPSTADLVAAIEVGGRGGGRAAAEQQERDHGGRAGVRPLVEGRARRADDVAASRPRGARRIRSVARRGGEQRGARRGRRRPRHRRGHRRLARRAVQRARRAQGNVARTRRR